MRKLRKPLSWLLAVCMLFSLLPGTALAADPVKEALPAALTPPKRPSR